MSIPQPLPAKMSLKISVKERHISMSTFCDKMVTVGRGRRQLGEIIRSPGTWGFRRGACLQYHLLGPPQDRKANLPLPSPSAVRAAGERFRNEMMICIKHLA